MIFITDKHNCCGCTACASICNKHAISMLTDAEGFAYPQVDTRLCTNCGLCELACPVMYRDNEQHQSTTPTIYAMHHSNEEVWKESSSGGAFTALTDYVFNQGGVVFGAAYDDDFKVVHVMATTPTEALRFRTSKYSQSDMSTIYNKVSEKLRHGSLVLFSGTPCQVEGLQRYLRKPFENLITCDIICTSVPSPKLFGEYIKFIENKEGSKVASINMKDKTIGWHKHQSGIRVNFANGKSWFRTPETFLWSQIFISGLASRPSCFQCRFTNYDRPGDITIGDYWGIEKAHPDHDDDRGVSLLMVNTPKGESIMEKIKPNIIYLESTKELCEQPRLKNPVKEPSNRKEFWKDSEIMDFQVLCSRYFDYKPIGKFHAIGRKLLEILKK